MDDLLGLSPDVRSIVSSAASDAIARGAVAVVLTGSFARGDAHAESDIDLHLLGDGPNYALRRMGGFLVSTSWGSAEQHRRSFLNPREAGGAVPGWRQALIVADPDGVARHLQQEAIDWTWERIGDDALNRWVAEQITGFAEEVHKLVIARERRHPHVAAIQRSILALRLAGVLSVHKRILYQSENVLWDRVAMAMDERWRVAQHASLGLGGESFWTTCRASLTLFTLAVEEIRPLMSAEEEHVCSHALALIATQG